MSEPTQKKAELRKLWRARRILPPAEKTILSHRICEIISKRPEFKQANRIALYAALDWEPDLTELFHIAGSRCGFPRVNRERTEIAFFPVRSLDELQIGYWGLREPPVRLEGSIQWQVNDLILVPGLVFDRYGGRLGSGKGFYDRALSRLPKGVKRWGVAFEYRVSSERLPMESHDIGMDAIVTEAQFLKP